MKYTTLENLARKLRGRLEISIEGELPEAVLTGYGQVASGKVVDPELITQITNEQEAYIELILGQIYFLPFQLTSPTTKNILQRLVEDLVISSLMQVHFEGTNPIVPAADISGASVDLYRNAHYLLAALTAGHNIFIPTMPAPTNQSVGMVDQQPLRLPGERLLGQDDRPDTVSRNYTFAVHGSARPSTKKHSHYFDDSSSPDPLVAGNDGRALGVGWLDPEYKEYAGW